MQEKKHERPKLIDETGNRYGKLVVLYRGKNRGNKTTWVCQCDCGNECVVEGGNLRSKNTHSCGCARLEALRKYSASRDTRNLIGKKYSKLTVEAFAKKVRIQNGHRYYWQCRCECGNTHIASTQSLQSGNVTSCGCAVKDAQYRKTNFSDDDNRNILAMYENQLLTFKELGDKLGITARQARTAVEKGRELSK